MRPLMRAIASGGNRSATALPMSASGVVWKIRAPVPLTKTMRRSRSTMKIVSLAASASVRKRCSLTRTRS